MSLTERAKQIILSPQKEWDIIAQEPADVSKIIMGYVVPLAAVAAIAAFIGWSFIGAGFGMFRMMGLSWGIYYGVTVFVSAIVSVYISAFIIDALASNFASEKNMGRSVQLVAYSFTPVWVAGILSILPFLSIIAMIAGLYGLYLLYLGFPKLKNTPADKHVPYFVVSLIVTVVVYWVLFAILGYILMSLMGLSSMATMKELYHR